MKYLIAFPLCVLLFYNSFAHAVSMYISVSPVSCNDFTYNIEVIQFEQPTSDILMEDILFFGDGTSVSLDLSQNGSIEFDGFKYVTKYTVKHSYPGPGYYTIAAIIYNRSSHIKNMSNSVNTPLFIETSIHLDPFMGCNSTPRLELIPRNEKRGSTYAFDLSCIDAEGDSLSYELITPLQNDGTPVVEYRIPEEFDHNLNKVNSKLSFDPYPGALLLNSKNLEGAYTIAVNIKEWRKINTEYHHISSSTLDYNLNFIDTENNPPSISYVPDTAIIAGTTLHIDVVAEDKENDQTKLNFIGDFFQLKNNTYQIDTSFRSGPVVKHIEFTPSENQVRAMPYKALFVANDNSTESSIVYNCKTMLTWITDKAHKPAPVKFFIAMESNPGKIKLEWIDVDDELGYIIERSDMHFPKFHRVALLPPNAISFHDSSVVKSNMYLYRIKAVGTTMSSYKTVEVNTADNITSLSLQEKFQQLSIFPNPSGGSFSVSSPLKISVLEIHDISGELAFKKEFDNSPDTKLPINISIDLKKGIYILVAEIPKAILRKKILIN